MDNKSYIAMRVAQELKDGDVVNLGIGLPTMVANYIPDHVFVTLHSENGLLGAGGMAEEHEASKYVTNAGDGKITIKKGGTHFHSADSFGIIRGGHVDLTVLGALQVDQEGNLANWMVPGKKVPGMGGAMDLVVGAKKVIVAMEHTAKGSPKILEKCEYPLTAVKVVNKIITEMAVIDVTDRGLELVEVAAGYTPDDVIKATSAHLNISSNLKQL